MAGRQPFRVPPALPAAVMKTYKIVAPVSTHWVPATCARVGCEAHEHGWVSYIDEGTGLGQRQAHFIRRESGRRFTEDRNDQGITEFTFEPGQECFASGVHQARTGRPERYLVTGGDWRGNPAGDRFEHTSAESWVDDFAIHQEKLRAAIEGA